jgi:hypothetical protein
MTSFKNCGNGKCLCNRIGISHEDLVDFITSHKEEALLILKTTEFTEEMQNKLTTLTIQLQKEKEQKDKLQQCLDIKEKENSGSHSMYKGEYRELHQEIIAGRLYGETYEVDGQKKMHMMDIRLKHRIYSYIVGLEMKEKQILTQNDIDKFRTDRLNNRFMAGIIVSTQAPIKGYVTKEHTYKMTENELYIYSNDANLIGITIGCFLEITEQRYLREQAACESTDELYNKLEAKFTNTVEHNIAMYKKWQSIQKANMDYDKQMMTGLINMGVPEDVFKNHKYVVTRSNCKGKKHPYGL